MANKFNWSLGHEGKGNVYPNGDISTWNIDKTGSPHHSERAKYTDEQRPHFKFYISPEGGLTDGSLGFENHTPKTDDQVIAEIVAQHPAIYDARYDNLEDPNLEPRVELPGGGYGHAYNLLDAISKVASEEGWADFHAELKLPRGVRRQVREWADKLKWPEGSEKDDQRRYHITILSMDEYDEDFAKWMTKQMQGRSFHFKSTGMDIFGDEHVVLRLESPEWTALVKKWEKLADEKELEPHKFDPPKAHITVGKSPNGWPQGVPDPHIEFDTRMFNINKNSAVDPLLMNATMKALAPIVTGEIPFDRDTLLLEVMRTAQQDGVAAEDLRTRYSPQDYYAAIDAALKIQQAQPQGEGQNLQYEKTPDLLLQDQMPWTPVPQGMEREIPGWGESYPTYVFDPRYPGRRRWSNESSPVDELKQWVDSFTVEQPSALSPHHTDADQFQPEIVAPVVQTPHVDPPSHPYKPYNWAEEGWDGSPLDRTAASEDEEMYVPGIAPQPVTINPISWPQSSAKPHMWDWKPQGHEPSRTPFLYNRNTRTVHIGRPGMIHAEIYDAAGVPAGGDVGSEWSQGELKHHPADLTDEPSWFTYGNPTKPDPDRDAIYAAVQQHVGEPLRDIDTEYRSRTAAETRKKRLERAQQIEQSVVGHPDQSKVIHEFPNGWTIRELQTYGDALREGELMGNCFTPFELEPESHHSIWEQHPEALWEEVPEDIYGVSKRYEGMPSNFERREPLPARLRSLRDPDNIPHLSEDENSIFGTHNVMFEEAKPEYRRMWHEFEQGGPLDQPLDFYESRNSHDHKATFECPSCDHLILGYPCPYCQYDDMGTPTDFKRMEREWYDQAWDEPGAASKWPPQHLRWRNDNATDVKFARESDQQGNTSIADSEPSAPPRRFQRQTTNGAQEHILAFESLDNEDSRKEMDALDHPRGRHNASEPKWNRSGKSQDDLYSLRPRESRSREADLGSDADNLRGMRGVVSSPSASLGWKGSGWHEA